MSTIGNVSIGNLTWNSDIKIEGSQKPNSDQDGVNTKTPPAMQLPLPNPSSKPDMMRMMAAFEDLIILMSIMAKEVQKGEREAELASLATKIAMLLSAAQEKQDGADKMMSQAIVSLVISVVSAAISVVGSAISLGGAAKGAGKAAAETKAIDSINQQAKVDAFNAPKLSKLTDTTIAPSETKINMATKMELVNSAFKDGAGKMPMIGQIFEGVSKGVGAGAGYTGTKGQAESMRAQAEADKIQARAEEVGSQAQRSQQMQQDMRDLLNKMTELLNAFYQAQDKIASAASH